MQAPFVGSHLDRHRTPWISSGAHISALRFHSATAAALSNAIASYDLIRTTRRPMPDGAVLQESGDVHLPTGEIVAAADIEGMPDSPTIPSEFADALDV